MQTGYMTLIAFGERCVLGALISTRVASLKIKINLIVSILITATGKQMNVDTILSAVMLSTVNNKLIFVFRSSHGYGL